MANVDYRDTLVTYLNSNSVEEACRNLSVTPAGLNYRLNTMRKAGVKVPKKQRAANDLTSELFIAQLNNLIRNHQKVGK